MASITLKNAFCVRIATDMMPHVGQDFVSVAARCGNVCLVVHAVSTSDVKRQTSAPAEISKIMSAAACKLFHMPVEIVAPDDTRCPWELEIEGAILTFLCQFGNSGSYHEHNVEFKLK